MYSVAPEAADSPQLSDKPASQNDPKAWHDLFGLATRQLTEKGLIADPNAPEVRHKGWFGVVWKHAVYSLEMG